MKKYLYVTPLALGVVLALSLFVNISTANAQVLSERCKPFETVFARGSGSGTDGTGTEFYYFTTQLNYRLANPDNILRHYQLGTEKLGNFKYPAKEVGKNAILTTLGASLSAGNHFEYGDSVKQGVGELQIFLKERYSLCKGKTKWILGGYSQGAQVMGQALSTLSPEIRKDILHVSLFGDPKLNLPEGKGFNPPACRNLKIYRSPWRRDIANCRLDNGSLSARVPYLPEDMKYKVGLWCNTGDPICGDFVLGTDSHGNYKDKGGAIDKAVQEVAVLIDRQLRDETRPTPTPDPEPDPEPVQLVDVSMPEPDPIAVHEIAIVINTSYEMRRYLSSADIDEIAETGRGFIDAQKSNGMTGRIALVEYRDSDSTYPARVLIDLTSDAEQFRRTVYEKLSFEQTPSDSLEGALHGYMTAMKSLSWSAPGKSYKALSTLSPSGFHEPDRTDSSTIRDVIQQSYRLGDVRFMISTPREHYEQYQPLAIGTDGIVGSFRPSLQSQGATNTIDQTPQMSARSSNTAPGRLVASFSSSTYGGKSGETITFDASSSYINNSRIVGYVWDLNGDGIPDYQTTEPFINHTYALPFSGLVRVQVYSENGQKTNAFAQVDISDKTPRPLPATPSSLTSKITQTTNGVSTVELTWSANDTNVDRWILTINDDAVGYLAKDRRQIVLTDVERAEAVSFGIVGQNSDRVHGQFAETSIPAVTTPVPDPGTPQNPGGSNPQVPPVTPPKNPCTQKSLLLRNICEAAERLKAQLLSALSKLYIVIGVR